MDNALQEVIAFEKEILDENKNHFRTSRKIDKRSKVNIE